MNTCGSSAGLLKYNRIVDNLPGSTSFVAKDGETKIYTPGFRLGEADSETEVIATLFT